jgi:hypothetical protein
MLTGHVSPARRLTRAVIARKLPVPCTVSGAAPLYVP